jgi:hypothetical protein
LKANLSVISKKEMKDKTSSQRITEKKDFLNEQSGGTFEINLDKDTKKATYKCSSQIQTKTSIIKRANELIPANDHSEGFKF